MGVLDGGLAQGGALLDEVAQGGVLLHEAAQDGALLHEAAQDDALLDEVAHGVALVLDDLAPARDVDLVPDDLLLGSHHHYDATVRVLHVLGDVDPSRIQMVEVLYVPIGRLSNVWDSSRNLRGQQLEEDQQE